MNITQVPKDPEFRKLLCVPEGKLLVDVDADALSLAHIKQIELGRTPNV